MEPIIYYGQNREDLILSAFFPGRKTGYYVDVGACHPVKYSVTQFFYEKGWRGINIEPQDKEFKLLKSKRRRDINLQVGVSDKSGTMTLRVYENESLSTLSNDIKSEYEQDSDKSSLAYTDKKIQVKTLAAILEESKVDSIQFLKVDVEGHEKEVLAGNNWKKYKPEVLCVEANNLVAAAGWRGIVEQAGYEKVFFDGLNDYYVQAGSGLKETFLSEYQRIIVAQPALSHEWKVQIDRVVNQLEKVQSTLDNYVEANKQLSQELTKVRKESVYGQLKRGVSRRLKHRHD